MGKRDSPEQIAGRILNIDKEKYQSISYRTIYTWIFCEEPKLKKHLRRISKKGKYRRRKGTKKREEMREEGKIRRIDTRPSIVEERKRIGDYEGDTIVGKDKKKRLLTNVDQASGYGLIDKIDTARAEILQDILAERFDQIPKKKRHTYTYDNGTEIGKEDADPGEKDRHGYIQSLPLSFVGTRKQ